MVAPGDPDPSTQTTAATCLRSQTTPRRPCALQALAIGAGSVSAPSAGAGGGRGGYGQRRRWCRRTPGSRGEVEGRRTSKLAYGTTEYTAHSRDASPSVSPVLLLARPRRSHERPLRQPHVPRLHRARHLPRYGCPPGADGPREGVALPPFSTPTCAPVPPPARARGVGVGFTPTRPSLPVLVTSTPPLPPPSSITPIAHPRLNSSAVLPSSRHRSSAHHH
ncbi:hypothetical protein C8J57DRAFT_105059 [Mycena rebaudengoi]|nr:hypothetical protein C8J57DRAFT_105059 [Mycena rebaudengoi]